MTGPGDPARSSEEQALRAGVEPARGAAGANPGPDEPEIEESPALLGDRMAGVEEQRAEER